MIAKVTMPNEFQYDVFLSHSLIDEIQYSAFDLLPFPHGSLAQFRWLKHSGL